MSDYELDDVSLKALESRLASAAPELAPAEQQELLYCCAFEAGQRHNRGRVRRWQAATAATAALLITVLVVPPTRDIAPAEERASVRSSSLQVPSGPAIDESPAARPRQLAAVELDAWQIERPATASLSEELGLFERLDPRMQSSSVAHLLRGFAEP